MPTAADKHTATRHDVEHSSWYTKANKFVLSKTLQGMHRANTTIIRDDIKNNINKIKQATEKNILMLGSPSASYALMAENLIEEIWLFMNPVLLGKGIPLFKHINDITKLKLIHSHILSNGVVCLHYKIKTEG